MKILVTGATGFLGAFLCRALEKRGDILFKLNSKNCDLTKENSLEKYVETLDDKELKLDLIIHLAAWTQAGDFCLSHPAEQWLINQKINTNVLAYWQKRQPQAKLLAMGTSCAYAPDKELIEENYLDGVPIESLFTYAMTKRMLYAGLLAMQKQYKMNYLCLVPSTLYGPNYHLDGRQMHFVFDLIRKILRGKFFGDKVTLWGDGEQKRELVYIDDFITAALQLMEKEENKIFNIGAGKEHSIKEFASAICEIVGYDFSKIEFDTSKYVGAKSKILNVDKLKKALPEYNNRELKDGLKKTIDWFLENKDKVL